MCYKIAFIDDNDLNAKLFEVYTNRKGWEFRWFSCAETFLKKANIDDYDIIIIDWFMPGMNGLELCDIIKSRAKIPLVLCTANSLQSDKEEALKHADDYLSKPVDRQDYYVIVEKHCGKALN